MSRYHNLLSSCVSIALAHVFLVYRLLQYHNLVLTRYNRRIMWLMQQCALPTHRWQGSPHRGYYYHLNTKLNCTDHLFCIQVHRIVKRVSEHVIRISKGSSLFPTCLCYPKWELGLGHISLMNVRSRKIALLIPCQSISIHSHSWLLPSSGHTSFVLPFQPFNNDIYI